MVDTILIVEDEPDVVDLVRYHLRRAGFDVLTALNGPAGLETATQSRPDAIVLDVMLPQMTGIEVCKALRNANETADIPILILTAKAEITDRIAGLELGVDDYITKPFSPRELVLRVQNLLRRLRVVRNSSVLTVDEFCVDKGNFEITVHGTRLDLTTTEFKLLAALGAWLGWKSLVPIVALSSLVGAAIGIGLVVLKGRDHQVPLAFGPYLAIAGAIALFFGKQLVALYLPG